MRVLTVGLVVSCAVPKAAPPQADAPPEQALVVPHAIPGEVMEFEATLSGLPLGRAVVGVGDQGTLGDAPALIVKARAQSIGLVAAFGDFVFEQETTLDVARGYTLASTSRWVANFAGEHEDDSFTQHERDGVHDLLSAAAAARAWRSSPGQRARIDLRVVSARITTRAVDAGREDEPITGKPAIRYECELDSGEWPFTIWISDDVARVPLRVDFGTPLGPLRGVLVDYRAPRG